MYCIVCVCAVSAHNFVYEFVQFICFGSVVGVVIIVLCFFLLSVRLSAASSFRRCRFSSGGLLFSAVFFLLVKTENKLKSLFVEWKGMRWSDSKKSHSLILLKRNEWLCGCVGFQMIDLVYFCAQANRKKVGTQSSQPHNVSVLKLRNIQR